MARLDNKVAVITGGSSGIGLATAQRFIEEGAQVVITGRNPETISQALETLGERAIAVQGDIADPAHRQALIDTVRAKFDRIDVLFLNAGIGRFAPIDQANEALFDEVFNINLKGPYFLVQAALPLLGKGASVILNTSATNQVGLPATSIYAASKAALRSFARTLSADLAPSGIRVNALSPGPVETPIYGKTNLDPASIDEFGKQIAAQVPLGRFGRAEELAGAAAFLASDDASFVVGAELVADGGFTQV